MSDQARITFTVGANTFEISGPADFVSAQAKLFEQALITAVENLAVGARETDEGADLPEAPPQDPAAKADAKSLYPNVLHFEGDKVEVLKTPTANTTSKKAVKLIIIYLWAKRQVGGSDSASDAELKELCGKHSCFDQSNFFRYIRTAKQFIRLDEGTKSCKLTVPGVEEAKKILEELNASGRAQDSRSS